MKVDSFLFGLVLILLSPLVSYAQIPNVRYFPVGELTFCKGCGHNRTDTWRGKFRVENLSDKDVILYGFYSDGEFFHSSIVQRRSPDVCEWQYPNGKIKDLEWSEKSSLEKEEFILKATQSIEFEKHFNEYDFNKPIRFTFYVGTKSRGIPTLKISDAFMLSSKPVEDENRELLKYEKPLFTSVSNDCDPRCKLSIEQAPSIRGIKLGMGLSEFKQLFPNQKIRKPDKYNSRYVLIYDKDEDAQFISATFLNDKIIKLEIEYNSVQKLKGTGNFYIKIAEKLGLEKFWTPYSEIFECQDFEVEVVPYGRKIVVIRDKANKEIWEKIVEDSYKKK